MRTPWKMTVAAFMLTSSLHAYTIIDQSPSQLLSRSPAQVARSEMVFERLTTYNEFKNKHDEINSTLDSIENEIQSLAAQGSLSELELLTLESKRINLVDMSKKYSKVLAKSSALKNDNKEKLLQDYDLLTTRAKHMFSVVQNENIAMSTSARENANLHKEIATIVDSNSTAKVEDANITAPSFSEENLALHEQIATIVDSNSTTQLEDANITASSFSQENFDKHQQIATIVDSNSTTQVEDANITIPSFSQENLALHEQIATIVDSNSTTQVEDVNRSTAQSEDVAKLTYSQENADLHKKIDRIVNEKNELTEKEKLQKTKEDKAEELRKIKVAKVKLKRKDFNKVMIKKNFSNLKETAEKLSSSLEFKASDKMSQKKVDSKKESLEKTREKAEKLIINAKAFLELIKDGETAFFKDSEVAKLEKALANFETLLIEIDDADNKIVLAQKELDENCVNCGVTTVEELDSKIDRKINKITSILEEIIDANQDEDDDRKKSKKNKKDEDEDEKVASDEEKEEDFKKRMLDYMIMKETMSMFGKQGYAAMPQQPQYQQIKVPFWGEGLTDYSKFSPFYGMKQMGTSMTDLFSFGGGPSLSSLMNNGQGITINNYGQGYNGGGFGAYPAAGLNQGIFPQNGQRTPSYYGGAANNYRQPGFLNPSQGIVPQNNSSANIRGTGTNFGAFTPTSLNSREISIR